MNILTDTLPNSLTVGGVETAINSDFRPCLKTILAYEDDELTPQEKQAVMIANLYPVAPQDIREAANQAVWFLNGGEGKEGAGGDALRLYSFGKDASFIFAAFRQTHGIDLQTAPLHWWSFLALFMDLGAETTFCQLVSLRKRLKSGKASKEERAAAREMGELLTVPEPDTRTIGEKEAEAQFMAALEKQRKR